MSQPMTLREYLDLKAALPNADPPTSRSLDAALARMQVLMGRTVVAELARLGVTRVYLSADGKLMLGPPPVKKRAARKAARHREAIRRFLEAQSRA